MSRTSLSMTRLAYDRVVAGDVRFRFVIDIGTMS